MIQAARVGPWGLDVVTPPRRVRAWFAQERPYAAKGGTTGRVDRDRGACKDKVLNLRSCARRFGIPLASHVTRGNQVCVRFR